MNFYNEHDQGAAAWLRELIREGLIPDGVVEQRDIQELREDDLADFAQVHLFAGIGGWPHALRLAGWPDDHPVWTGSCPCQPFSDAGGRRGEADERHLWPDMRRLGEKFRPPVIFGEQVASRLGRDWLAGVRADLEALGYAVGAADLCAAGTRSPQIRQRLFWVADAGPFPEGGIHGYRSCNAAAGGFKDERVGKAAIESARCSTPCRLANSDGSARERTNVDRQDSGSNGWNYVGGSCNPGRLGNSERDGLRVGRRTDANLTDQSSHWSVFDLVPCRDGKVRRIEPGLKPLVDGFPGRVGMLRGYGNAIVPQVAAAFITAYLEAREASPC